MLKKRKSSRKGYGIIVGLVGLAGILFLAGLFFYTQIQRQSPDGQSEKVEGFTPVSEKNPDLGIELKDKGLEVEAVGRYSGAYVEDGSDTEIEDVPAVLVTNHSQQMLQIAEIELQMEDGKTALFRLTNIPSGKTVLALDLNKNRCGQDEKLKYLSEAEHYFDEASLETERFDTEGADGRLVLKNKTDRVYDCVYVYYKTKITEDTYLGGITYRVPYEEIPAMTQMESEAGHYTSDKSEIINLQIIETDRSEES